MKFLKKWYDRAQQYLETRKDKKLLVDLLADISEEDMSYFKTSLECQLRYLNESLLGHAGVDRDRKVLFMKTAKEAIKRLLVIRGIVGIQPMAGPVGMVYSLRFSETETPTEFGTTSTGLKLEVVSDTVTAGSRKLQTGFNLETLHETQSLFQLDFADEFPLVLGSEVAEEMVAEVIQNLVDITKPTRKHVILNSPYVSDNLGKLLVAIQGNANQIGLRTRRGCGNFIITTPIGTAMLSSINLSGVKFDGDMKAESNTPMALRPVGRLVDSNGTTLYDVYSSITVSGLNDGNNEVLIVGYKGKSGEIDTGYIYSPYVPVMPSNVIIDPATYEPRVHVMTRYGKTTFTDQKYQNTENYYRAITFNSREMLLGEVTDEIEKTE
jgi:hypothetical protein